MSFDNFWNHEVEKCPQLGNGDARPRIAVFALKAALKRAYEAGRNKMPSDAGKIADILGIFKPPR